MSDIDVLNDHLRFLLKNGDYERALEVVREWEDKTGFHTDIPGSDFLLSISKTYYLCKHYENSIKYLSKFESEYSDQCLKIEYLEQKYKLLILEGSAGRAIELIKDSLLKSRPEEESFNLLHCLGSAHFWNGEYMKANRCFRKCQRYFLDTGNDFMLGMTLYMMGYLAFQRNMLFQAESYFEDSLDKFNLCEQLQQAGHCYKMLGIIKYRNGEYTLAKGNLSKAKKKYDACGSRSNVVHCKIANARVAMFQSDYALSEKILKGTYREASKLNYRRAQALSLEFLGEVYFLRGQYGKAERWLVDALNLADQTAPRGDVAAEVYRRLGDVQIELGKLNKAEKTLTKAEELCCHLQDKYELGSVFRARAVLEIRKGNPEEARSWIDEASIVHKTINERFELARTYTRAAEEYLNHISEYRTTSILKTELLRDASSFVVEAIHLFSELNLKEKVSNCRKLLRKIDMVSGDRKIGRADKELKFQDKWLHGGIFVARSGKMLEALEEMKNYADRDISILLTGETGTGKEMAARYIHRMGDRADGPFIAVNCASVSSEIFESEFFGHKRGAFTGAISDRKGLIEKADGGLLFLDEITELPQRSQAKLLRVLDDGFVRRMGSCEENKVDFKIISASNRDIEQIINKGKLREDLYYRISGREIHLKPLRERKEDIEPLLSYYLDSVWIKMEKEAIELLKRYHWPGNVRELVNIIRGMGEVVRGDVIRLEDLPGKILNVSYGETGKMNRREKDDFKGSGPAKKREFITEALRRSSGNRAAAARELGISRKTLYKYLREDQ